MKKMRFKKAVALTLSLITLLTSAQIPTVSLAEEIIPEETYTEEVFTETEETVLEETSYEEILTEEYTEGTETEVESPAEETFVIEEEINTEVPETETSEGVTEETTEEKTTTAITLAAFDQTEHIENLSVHITAPEGVFPEGSYFTVRKAEEYEESAVKESIENARETKKNVYDSLIVDITVFDKYGNEIQPDTSYGKVSIVFGTYVDSEIVENPEVTADVYHIEETDFGYEAEKLDSVSENYDEEIIDAEELISVETEGFSYYVIEYTYETETEEYHWSTNGENILLSSILEGLGIILDDEISLVETDNEETVSITELEGDWMINMTQPEQTATLSISVGNPITQVYDIILESNNIRIDSAYPSVQFIVEWNDNTGSTEKDPSNMTDRPSWEESKENYAIYYTVNDGEYIKLTEETMESIGISQMYDIDAIVNTTDNNNQWQFNIDSSTYISLPETITIDGEQQKIKYFLMQENQESGKTNYDGYLVPEINIAGQNEKITNTVEIKYEAYLNWQDNENAYNTRPEIPVGHYETDLFTVQRISSASAVVEDIEDGHVYLDVDEKGNIKIVLDYLPAYDEDGQPFIYKLTSNISAIEGTTDYYSALYTNVGQNTHETDALYNGGTVDETLTNEISFSFNVEWIDGEATATDRPTTTMYLYVLPENVTDITKASPVKNFDGQVVVSEDGKHTLVSKVDGSEELPKYDSNGVRLVYFALEKGLAGDYVVDVDNNTSIESEKIIEDFDKIKSDYVDSHGNKLTKYVLNEGTIYNRLTGSVEVPCELTLYIDALQGSNDVDLTFTLQKLDDDGNWINVLESDCLDPGDDTPVQYVFDKYYPEEASVEFKSPAVSKYDSDTGKEIVYRWVQSTVRLNNGKTATVGTDSDSWDESRSKEEILYDYIGENISLGKSAPGVGSTNVDVFLIPEMEVRKEDGVWKTYIVDEINAAELIKINKVWTVYGNEVSDEVAEAGGYADYVIKRNDGKHSIAEGETPDESTLYDMYGNPVYNVRLNGAEDDWTDTLPLLSRFDKTGKEYSFTVTESYYTKDILRDKYGKSFSHTYNYDTQVEDIGDDQSVKEIVSNHINYITNPGGLYFEALKTWLDGSDLIARNDVFIGIFKIETGQPVKMFKLNTKNNWTDIVGISEGMTCLDGSILEGLGTQNDYILLEIGVGTGNEPEVLTLYNNKNWTELTSEDLAALKTQISGSISEYNSDNALGTLGTDDTEKKLQYYYNVFTEQTSSGYYYDFTNQRFATIDLELTKTWTDDNRLTESTFEIKRTDADGTNPVVLGTFSLPTEGTFVNDNSYTYSVKELPKYDSNGDAYIYSVMEKSIDGISISQPESGTEVDAYVSVTSGDVYHCNSKKATTDYSDDHHNGDVQHWTSSNVMSDSYPLEVNIIWYDDGRSNKDVNRPNVYVNVYRITDDAMFSDEMTLREYIESDEYDESVLAARLEELQKEASLITPDKIWNTIVNDWMWTTSLGDVPRYDDSGHRYIYFAEEGFNGSSNKYKNGYINDSAADVYPETSGDPTSAKDVLDVGSYYSDMVEHTVTLLSDGYHLASGSASKYATRTIINFLEDTRTIGGRKLWKMPTGWTIPEENLPEITFEVYRSTSKMTNDDGEIEGSYTNSDIKKWADSLGLEPIITFTLNSDEASPFSFTGYQYSIQYEQYTDEENNTKVQKYNEYGQTYYYYVYETSVIEGYPAEEIEYSTTDFFIVNVYKFQPPYVQVKVSKNWAIDERTGEDSLLNLAPVTISLYAQAVNDDGVAVGDPVYINQTTLEPTEDGYAEYTFTTYKDGVTKIPLTAHNGKNFKFFTIENMINGYDQEASEGGRVGSGTASYVLLHQISQGDDETWSNVGIDVDGAEYDDTVRYSNTYTGDETSLDVTKNWEDDYVDNDLYRPDSITLTVNRKSGGVVDEDYSLDITLYKKDFTKTSKWTASVEDLVKYDSKGKLYTYFIAKETFDDTDESASEIGDKIGYYKLTKLSNRSITNTLIDSVSVELNKTWSYAADDGNIDITTYDKFDEFRKMNAFPKTVQYVLQRKTESTDWEYVPASLGDDVKHKINLNGDLVLGYEVNISKITRSSFKKMFNLSASWEHLPRTVLENTDDPYEYRIIEIFTWNSGEVDIADGTESVNGITPTINVDNSTLTISESINNNLSTTKVKLAKEWEDENGFDDLRPEKITLRLISKKDDNEGYLDFDLTTTGNDISAQGSIYYSEEFYIPSIVTTPLTQENYSVEEFYSPEENEKYYARFDGGFVVDDETEPGVSIIHITNPSVTERRTINVSGTKNWTADEEWHDTLRPVVTFTLQYLEQGSEDNWITMSSWDSEEESSIRNFTDTKQSEKYENVASSSDKETVTWNNLYKYWKNNSVDGIGELIKYRIVETTDAAVTSYAVNNNGIISYSYTENTDDYTNGSLTNTLTEKTINISKNWNEEDSKETFEDLQKLIGLKAIPEEIKISILYSLKENGEYTEYKELKEIDVSVLDLAAGITETLPELDKNGQKIRYKFAETKIRFKDGDFQDAFKGISLEEKEDIELEENTVNAVFSNTLKVTDVSATKTWDDEDNRESYQNTVYLQLYRDGVAYEEIVSIEKDPETNTWSTVTWNDLPYYKNDSNEESVYTVKEIAIGEINIEDSVYVPKYSSEKTEYTTDYTSVEVVGSDSNRTITITNEYTPNKGVVFASKTWNLDEDWNDVTRPDSIEVKLQYSVDNKNTWEDVTKSTLTDGRYADDGIYTTSDVTQYISKDNLQAVWNDLPVYSGGRADENAVVYRVVETSVNGYVTTYENNECTLNPGRTQTVEITNTAEKESVRLTKNWTDFENNDLTKTIEDLINTKTIPEEIEFEIFYKMTDKEGNYDDEWTSSGITFTALMSELTNEGKVFDNLPKDDKYEMPVKYKIEEIGIRYKDETTISAAGEGVTLTFVETEVDETVKTLGFTNKLDVIEVSVSKEWLDENNREEYEDSVTVQLYRDGRVYEDAVVLSEENNWTFTWTELPAYKNKENELSVYAVEELKIGEEEKENTKYSEGIFYEVTKDGIVTSYTDFLGARISKNSKEEERNINIVNKYVPERGIVSATKTWNDNGWNEATRPGGVKVTLEFSTDNGASWSPVVKSTLENDLYEDDGIYTTSEVTQVISEENQTATWENLPVYKNGHESSSAVMYRVVETSVDGYETTYKNNECKLDENKAQSIEVVNTLVLRDINVTKNWTDESGNVFSTDIDKLIRLNAIPSDIRFAVLYKITDGEGRYGEWTDSGFTFDASMEDLLNSGVEYNNLPEYDKYGEKIIYKISEVLVKYSNESEFHAASDGVSLTEKETEVTEEKAALDFTNKLKTTEVVVSKIWEDENNRDDHEGTITVQLYRDGVAYDEPVTISKEDDWTCTWVDLPVYKNEGSEASGYTVEETKINEKEVSKTVYKDGVSYKVKGSDEDTKDYTKAIVTPDTENEIIITNKYAPERGTFTASKIWEGDEDWYQVSRPDEIKLTLEYSVDGGQTYSEVTKCELTDGLYPDGRIYTTSDVTQYVTAENQTAKWDNLPVYYNNDTKIKVLYRVVETEVANYETSYSGNEVSLTTKEETHADVINTLITTSIKLNKKWYQKETGEEITDLEKLVSFDALPKQLIFKLEFSTDNGNTWNAAASLNSDGTYTFNTLDRSVTIDTKIPQYMKDQETSILYRITECVAIYQNEKIEAEGNKLGFISSIIDKSFVWDGNTVPIVAADNIYESGSIRVVKEWNDEDNRDALEKSVSFTLTSSDTTGKFEAVLSQSNSWEYTWNDLPVYSHDGKSLAKYSAKENVPDEYSVSYVPESHTSTITNGGTAVITGINTHIPYRDIVSAEKVWNDLENKFDARTTGDIVLLALQYKDGDEWVFVDSDETLTDTDIYAGEKKAYTSSALVQEADGNTKKAVWQNVPVNYNGKAITYRVVEVKLEGDEYVVSEAPGYSYKSDEFVLTKNTNKQVTATNTLILQKIQFAKTWTSEFDQEGYGTRPDKVVFEVSYSHGSRSGYFEIELTKDSSPSWTSEEIEIPYVDAEGNKYNYSISERIEYSDETIVEGKLGGYEMSLSESETNNWSLTEKEDNNWTLINTTNVPDTKTLVITDENDLYSGNLVIAKIWNDADNRDSLRRNVTVELLRDGQIFGEEIVLSPENNWSYEWVNLPVYKNSGSEKSKYEVKEIKIGDQDVVDYKADNWIVSVADDLEIIEDEAGADSTQAEIKNTYIPNTLSVSAAKAWSDGNDKYLLSPKNIKVHLEYSIDYDASTGSGTWNTVEHVDNIEDAFGTNVCTTSEVEQTIVITGEKNLRESSVVTWNDLPEYVRISGSSETESVSKKVYYRVKESIESSDPYYIQTSTVKTYDDRNDMNTAEIVLTNTMETGIIRATKSWNDSSDTSQRPSNITFVLYRDGEEFDRQTVKTTGVCRYIWTGLPVYKANGEKYVYSVREDDVAFGYVASYTDCDNIELTTNRVSDAKITNELYVGSITVNKVWEHDIPADRPTRITFLVYRDGELFSQYTIRAERSGEWKAYTIKNLPVYKEGTEDNREKSVYTVVEKHVEGYTTAYSTNSENIVFEATMEDNEDITVTNTQRTGNLKINKIWLDEENRHNIRTNVTINIYRDMPDDTTEENKSKYLYTTWTAADTTDWENLFEYLPTYQKGSDTEYSVYTLEEAGQDESYEVTWSDNGIVIEENSEGMQTVTNTYVPEKKNLIAKKEWDDFNNTYEERPSSVTFTLNWSSDGGTTWKEIEQGTLEDGRYPDGGVYTTSEITQTINCVDGEWESALWENLPCEILGEDGEVKTLTYKIVEDSVYNYRPIFDYDEKTGIVLSEDTTTTVVTNRYIRFMMPFSGEGGIWKMMGLGTMIIVGSVIVGVVVRKKKNFKNSVRKN